MSTSNRQEYGGNLVSTLTLGGGESFVFADNPYHYRLESLATGSSRRLDDLATFTVYLVSADQGVVVSLGDGRELAEGDAVQVEADALELAAAGAAGGSARLLVAGCREASGRPAGILVTRSEAVKKVVKPWGHELWINGEHPSYAFKQIALNRGFRTSLQYHRMKRETNVLFDGRIALHYKGDATCPNDRLSAAGVAAVELAACVAIDVFPDVVHRIEALSDTLLYEVSTPHLDDVIRISDDSGRPDGRIAAEHGRGGA